MARRTGRDASQQDILEKQLEMLFSDVAVPDLEPTAQPHQPTGETAADPIATILSSLPSDRPYQARLETLPTSDAKRAPRLVSRKHSLIIAATVLTLWFTVCGLFVINRGWAAQLGSRGGPPAMIERSATDQVQFDSTATPADVFAAEGSRTEAPQSDTTRIGASEEVEPAMPATPPRTPTPLRPSATRALAVWRADSDSARDVATKELPTITATRTATAIPPTPTLAPARPVHIATATPVPAWSIGLGSIPAPVPRVPMSDKAINIVLLGSDQRPDESEWRTDVIIVVSVDPERPSFSMLSVPRDTWLYIPNWTYQRINLADTHGTQVGYPGGGPGLVKATIEYNFGIHVDYFARVDFAGLMRIVDALGGIEVLLDCPVADGFPDDPISEDPSVVTQIDYPEPGLYHLDGKHALWLARSRKTTSEFARSRRQHRILQGIWRKANDIGYLARLPDLWEELTASVQTDLSLDDMLWLTTIGLQLGPSQINSGYIDGRYLTAWVSPGGAGVLLPHTEAILEALERHFNPYPYKAPQGLSEVEVWNGSGHEDWGLLAADRLANNGFRVINIQEADTLYDTTAVIDFVGERKGSPVPLLRDLFTADSTHVSPQPALETGVPFRLIIGADYQPCEWPTPARWSPTPTPSATTTGH
jgi:LCP family protein required for cell wall assembly